MMNEEKKNKNKNFIKEVIVIMVVGLIINLFCFFICSITGHAASTDLPDGTLPYNIHNYHNINTFTDENVINTIFSDTDVINAIGNNNYIFFPVDYGYTNNGSRFYVDYRIYVSPSLMYNYDANSNYLDNGVWLTGYQLLYTYRINNDGSFYSGQYRGIQSSISSYKALGSVNTGTCSFNGKTITNGYPLALGSDIYSSNNFLVFTNASSGINIGEFADLPNLDELLNNISNTWEPPSTITGHALPSSPTENPNNNDFQNRLQMFQYLADTITQNFGNLGYNLKKWFDNIQQKLTDVANSISQNIYNGFKTLMDNIKDFFGPKIDAIIDKINWLFEPFSSEELADNLDNGSFSSDILGLTSSVTTFGESLTSGTEPNSCTFTLDFRNSYYNFGVCEFSLDWILPMRPGIRLVIGCFCVYSLIVSIFTSINTYIGGTSSINDDI